MSFIDDFNRLKNNKIFSRIIFTFIAFILIVITCFFMLKYNVEGEKDLPFILSKIIVISSAEGKDIEATDTKWSFNLLQNNDIYININKNENSKRKETIRNIRIENIQIDKKDSIGNIKNFKPAQDMLFKNDDSYIITDSLEFTGSTESNINELKIGNQGGTILFRSSNTDIGTYTSNDDEIIHDGTLLSKVGIAENQIQYSIRFDLIIETSRGIKYKGTINLDLPTGNILEEGRSSIEKTEFNDIIFKRI